MNEIEINVSKVRYEIRINEKGMMLAQVSLIYGELKIKGYRIMQSKLEGEDYFIEPPSIRTYGTFMKIVFIEDPVKWKEIQKLMIGAYKKAKKNHDDETKDLPEEKYDVIDPDDIPL